MFLKSGHVSGVHEGVHGGHRGAGPPAHVTPPHYTIQLHAWKQKRINCGFLLRSLRNFQRQFSCFLCILEVYVLQIDYKKNKQS